MRKGEKKMLQELKVPLSQMVICLSSALDLISPAVVYHHKRVAYIAFRLAQQLGLSSKEQTDLLMAGAVHDIGALSLKDRLNTLVFEKDNLFLHALQGNLLLQDFAPLAHLAPLILYHHLPWEMDGGKGWKEEPVPLGTHILHLADRVDVLINSQKEILGQAEGIMNKVQENSGRKFAPRLVEAFRALGEKEYFWLDLASFTLDKILINNLSEVSIVLDWQGITSLARLFSHIIDFRSHFTAAHSSGVSASAESLAELAGLSVDDCLRMRIAGYLHDLGKLAIPEEILEKPAALTPEERNVIKGHTFYTYRILENIQGLETINSWASFHHERLDGKGYPFHRQGDNLDLGARIMAVADVFTAITEDRPYRPGMVQKQAVEILQSMAKDGALDQRIVNILEKNYPLVNAARIEAQKIAQEKYQDFDKIKERENTAY